MLDPKRVRRQLLVPRLKGDALDWVERALSIGMGYDDRTVTRAFVDTFPMDAIFGSRWGLGNRQNAIL